MSRPREKIETDTLLGGHQIAEYLSAQLGRPVNRRQAYSLIARRVIPAGKFGEECIASREAIRERLTSLARGEVSA